LSARRPADQLHHPHRADPARRASPGLLVVGGGGGGGPAVGGTVKGGGRGARRGPPRNGRPSDSSRVNYGVHASARVVAEPGVTAGLASRRAANHPPKAANARRRPCGTGYAKVR